ncbi:MAG: hypothetical protein ACHQ50_05375 [Fimbriimonadales bacterium]
MFWVGAWILQGLTIQADTIGGFSFDSIRFTVSAKLGGKARTLKARIWGLEPFPQSWLDRAKAAGEEEERARRERERATGIRHYADGFVSPFLVLNLSKLLNPEKPIPLTIRAVDADGTIAVDWLAQGTLAESRWMSANMAWTGYWRAIPWEAKRDSELFKAAAEARRDRSGYWRFELIDP